MLLTTAPELDRPCIECGDREAVASIDTVPGGPPLAVTGELCGACIAGAFSAKRRADPFGELRNLDAPERLGEIERVRRRLVGELEDLRRLTVGELRRRGWSWGKIGRAGGVTGARAQQLGSRGSGGRRQRTRRRASAEDLHVTNDPFAAVAGGTGLGNGLGATGEGDDGGGGVHDPSLAVIGKERHEWRDGAGALGAWWIGADRDQSRPGVQRPEDG